MSPIARNWNICSAINKEMEQHTIDLLWGESIDDWCILTRSGSCVGEFSCHYVIMQQYINALFLRFWTSCFKYDTDHVRRLHALHGMVLMTFVYHTISVYRRLSSSVEPISEVDLACRTNRLGYSLGTETHSLDDFSQLLACAIAREIHLTMKPYEYSSI